jgi:hypothetical protein
VRRPSRVFFFYETGEESFPYWLNLFN